MSSETTSDSFPAASRNGAKTSYTPLADPPTGNQNRTTQVDLHGRLVDLSLQATRTIARLLCDQRALSDAAGDGYSGAITQMLDVIATELGLDP